MASSKSSSAIPAGLLAAVAVMLLVACPAQGAGVNWNARVTMDAGDCAVLRDSSTVTILETNLNNCSPPPGCTLEAFPGWRNPERTPGIFCSVTGRVTVVVLPPGRVVGSLPASWANIRFLRVVALPGKNTNLATGCVPFAWWLLTSLTDLDVGNNPGLTGPVPSAVLSRPNLQYVRVAYSGISGNASPYKRTAPGVRMTLVVKGLGAEVPEICGFPDATVDVRRQDPVTGQLLNQVLPVCPGSFIGRRMLQ